MGNIVDSINGLVQYLPANDIPIVTNLVKKRDFDSVYEIVDSDIYIIKRARRRNSEDTKYKDIDLDKLITLKAEVSNYLLLINGEEYDY